MRIVSTKRALPFTALFLITAALISACADAKAQRTATVVKQTTAQSTPLDLQGGSRIQLQADCVYLSSSFTLDPGRSENPFDVVIATAYPTDVAVAETPCAGEPQSPDAIASA